jgi:hypothetical protein
MAMPGDGGLVFFAGLAWPSSDRQTTGWRRQADDVLAGRIQQQEVLKIKNLGVYFSKSDL